MPAPTDRGTRRGPRGAVVGRRGPRLPRLVRATSAVSALASVTRPRAYNPLKRAHPRGLDTRANGSRRTGAPRARLEVEGDDAVWKRGDHRPGTLFALREGHLSRPTIGHVVTDAEPRFTLARQLHSSHRYEPSLHRRRLGGHPGPVGAGTRHACSAAGRSRGCTRTARGRRPNSATDQPSAVSPPCSNAVMRPSASTEHSRAPGPLSSPSGGVTSSDDTGDSLTSDMRPPPLGGLLGASTHHRHTLSARGLSRCSAGNSAVQR